MLDGFFTSEVRHHRLLTLACQQRRLALRPGLSEVSTCPPQGSLAMQTARETLALAHCPSTFVVRSHGGLLASWPLPCGGPLQAVATGQCVRQQRGPAGAAQRRSRRSPARQN